MKRMCVLLCVYSLCVVGLHHAKVWDAIIVHGMEGQAGKGKGALLKHTHPTYSTLVFLPPQSALLIASSRFVTNAKVKLVNSN